jgi:peptide/nickel transport system substrate-binding protein
MAEGKRRQSRGPRGPQALLACLGLAALGWIAGCGQAEEPDRTITISHTAEPQSLDPAYAYEGTGFGEVGASEPLSVVYTPLLTYRHAPEESGAELIPGLAQNLPEISDDGLTYDLALRRELEYPNGIAVRASDFEHTVKRVLTAGSPAVRLLEGIEGVDEYLETGDPGADIAGIVTDDDSGDIQIRLTEPDASFSNVLAMWFLGLVPRNTQFRDHPDSPPPGVGPYDVVESEPGERFVLERSETFPGLDIPDIPTGSVDRITVEVADDVSDQAEDVLDGRLDYMRDSPPAEIKSTLLSQNEDRYREHVAPATYLFLLDTSVPPFDHPAVREAANLVLDQRTMARAFDGELEPACSLLPPGIAGYDEEMASTGCPYGDPADPPDVAAARRLVERAGATGSRVLVAGSDEEGVAEATEAYAEMLEEIGLDAETRLLPPDEYVRQLARGERLGDATFMSVFLDFPHPLNAFSHLVADAPGRTIGPSRDAIDDPVTISELDRLNREPDAREVADDWAALDRSLVSPPGSYFVPLGHPRGTTFVSERIDPDRIVFHPVFLNDYSTFVLTSDVEGQER